MRTPPSRGCLGTGVLDLIAARLDIGVGWSALRGVYFFFFFQAEDGIRDLIVTGVQTCALPISSSICSYTDSTELPDHSYCGLRVGIELARREMFSTASCEPVGFCGDQALPYCCSSIFSPGQLIVRKMSPSRLPGGSPFMGGCV